MRRCYSDFEDTDLSIDLIRWGILNGGEDERMAIELAVELLGYDPREGGDDE